MNIDLNFTIFGGTGDLTFRKLLPALYNMHMTKALNGSARIVIIGRRDYDSQTYLDIARDWVKKYARLPFQEEDFARFGEMIHYYRMDFTDLGTYRGLDEFYKKDQIGAHIFYLAVAPRFFQVIADGLSGVEHASSGKVIIEKPFGENLPAARELNERLESLFSADGIYRIDHYLGKEMVRNIQAIRFMNPIFTDIWNCRYVDSVQISALEDVGVETRGGYYDHSGALKDMVQNHLFQIMTIVAMEQPEQFFGPEMHAEQLKVLRALRRADASSVKDTVVLGQYEGYRGEPSVNPESSTETYAGLRLFIDNERWRGTPFYIRTGKKTGKREMEVAMILKSCRPDIPKNILNIKIQPTEGVYFRFNIKKPGDFDDIVETNMDFCQNCSLENRINTPEAYERLLTACIRGERSWFSQWDQIEICWNYIEELKKLYSESGLPVYPYKPGDRGPAEADRLTEKFGDSWFELGGEPEVWEP